MKTFQIRISKNGMHRCLKFKSELPMESVLAAVKAVVKNTYHVSIKEIHWRVPEDRDIMWAIKEAASIRFYHKVWKKTINEVPTKELICTITMPKGTKVCCNYSTNTFFDILTPYSYITLDISKINMLTNLNIYTTNGGIHPYYLKGQYEVKCIEYITFTEVVFYKIYTKEIVSGEFVTEEL